MRAPARVVGSVGVAALLALGTSAPAYAADELELSLDGVSWSTVLGDEVFARAGTMVPGDVIESDLWVRNASQDRARVDVQVSDEIGAAPGTFPGDLALTIDGTVTPGGTTWRGPDLAPGATARIPLVLVFDAASLGGSRDDVSAVLEAVILTQTAAGPGSSPGPGAGSTPGTGPTPRAGSGAAPAGESAPPSWVRGLAHTGAEPVGALALALAATGTGFLLLVARRRARRSDA